MQYDRLIDHQSSTKQRGHYYLEKSKKPAMRTIFDHCRINETQQSISVPFFGLISHFHIAFHSSVVLRSMKRQQQDKSCPSQHTTTLRNFWSKKHKANELSNTKSTNSKNSSATVTITQGQTAPTSTSLEEYSMTLIEARTASTSLIPDQHQSPASSDVTLCGLSISSDHPPVQRILSSYSANKENRCSQLQWCRDCPWLEYFIMNDSAYCYYCCHFGESLGTKRMQVMLSS